MSSRAMRVEAGNGAGVAADAAVELQHVLAVDERRERLDLELRGQFVEAILGRPDPLAADLDDLATADVRVERSPPDAVARLDHDRRRTRPGERPRGGEAGEARADHDHIDILRVRAHTRPTVIDLPAARRGSRPASLSSDLPRRWTLWGDGPADAVRVRRRRGHRPFALRAPGAPRGAGGRGHGRAPPPPGRRGWSGGLVHLRHGRPRLRDRRPGPAQRPAADPRDRHARRLRPAPAGAASGGPGRGLGVQPHARAGPHRGRRVRVGVDPRRQPGPRLRTLRGADPGGRDHRLGGAGLHRRQAGGRAGLRGRLGRGPVPVHGLRPAPDRSPLRPPGPDPDRPGCGDGGGRGRDGGRSRPALPERDRRRPARRPRQPDRGDRGERRRSATSWRRFAAADLRPRRRARRRRRAASACPTWGSPRSLPPGTGSTRPAARPSAWPSWTPRSASS